MRRLLCLFAFPLLLSLPLVSHAGPDVLRVGASEALMPTLEPLVDRYQIETRNKVLLIGGGTDELGEQVRQGTPYDVLISEQAAALTHLHHQGHGEKPRPVACQARPMQELTLVRGERRALASHFLDYLEHHDCNRH
ncbi:substrate-binding domain-containing protein [Pseudomonas sp. ZM23]|uniref:Substrate-binding domain-containing protein n=1 Tax=Pseudomonas triclosanedens TaxID=2961893 RepID=A0ABY6ZYZ8_9PSED|nr:substrate-binding domain-containing protein [Pseudomonas triclosanedens]MCP8463018.1 substrate-binding domain-containing protein [Pseudomonas triclosanedens]MCP8468638.1 substrate-binding domain-containing protein [Pseudomonas triclosanedens]MCP8475360.1 substrate-binding domain-containing protein [Pseudomonas triclosanedens]WAI50192.1 substrate-binding domain-containing protein [Pseudomonas triclosanedens]